MLEILFMLCTSLVIHSIIDKTKVNNYKGVTFSRIKP